MIDLAKNHEGDVEKFDNGVVIYDKNFFNKFSGVKDTWYGKISFN